MLPVTTLDNKKSGEIDLDDAVFGLEPRGPDLLHACGALAARQAPRRHPQDQDAWARFAGTTAKPLSPEGHRPGPPGLAAAGPVAAAAARRSVPVVTARSRLHALPKKVRKLGLKTALSAKAKAGS